MKLFTHLPVSALPAASARLAVCLLTLLLSMPALPGLAQALGATTSPIGAHLLAQVDAAAGQPEAVAPTAHLPVGTRLQTGRVLDERGRPLSGATVMLQGSQQVVSTDASGSFVLEVPAGDYNFVFSFAGYSDEAVAGRNGPLTITLVPDLGKRKQFRYHHRHGRLVGKL